MSVQTAVAKHDIKDIALADEGRRRTEWAERSMPVLRQIRARFAKERPLGGTRLSACLHVTTETANLMITLRAAGAEIALCASNPLSTQDDVAAALATDGAAAVFARAGVDRLGYDEHIHRALDAGGVGPGGPGLVIDDGGDLVNTLHEQHPELLAAVRGGCESTATGVIRLRRMADEGALAFPMVAADATTTKRMFDNTCGTGQSVIDGVLRATNTLLAGRVVVVAGYGACGRGIAEAARGLGAQVVVTEVDPVRALEAVLAGFRVLPMADAAPAGEVFITATGSRDVIAGGHLPVLRDGAILANAGHFDVEIDVQALAGAAVKVTSDVRPHTDEYLLADGRRLLLLAEGRVVNLVAAEGNPPQVMDVAFAGQALVLAWLAAGAAGLPPGVHAVPAEIDEQIARLTLESSGARIDALTPAQRDYLNSWRLGS
jgi:adenosylhomocysteinase